MNKLIEQLKIHEGFRSNVYTCSGGKKTVGYGRNLDDVGLTVEESEMLLRNDVLTATTQVLNAFPWMSSWNDARSSAIINLTFNIGINGVKKFKNALSSMKENDFENGAFHLLDSKWAAQVGDRAIEIAEQIRTGKWA